MKKKLESFTFTDLASLRDWLNQFETTDLSTVHIETRDEFSVKVDWVEETLSDGSTVNNAFFS